jgi:hypothetical protein
MLQKSVFGFVSCRFLRARPAPHVEGSLDFQHASEATQLIEESPPFKEEEILQ